MKKKWREIRSAVTMMCVMVAMLSTATYAWFTITDSPTVTGLEMTAASTAGLKVSKDGTTNTFFDAISVSNEFPEDQIMLTPVSTKDMTPNFYEPVYTGNVVNSLESTALTDLTGFVAKTDYYLLSESGATVNVGIVTTDPATQTGNMGIDGNNRANIVGSFVRTKSTANNTDALELMRSVRIGFVVGDSTEMIVYEPNNDGIALGGTSATNNVTGTPASTVISGLDGIFTTKGSGYTSEGLFTVGADPVKITMYIWLEGTDDDCVNEIMKDVIQAQIQFTVVENAGSGN